MKRYDKKLFITTVVMVCINCLMSAYHLDLTEFLAWCLLLLAVFLDKWSDKEIDKLRERETYWYKVATRKVKEAGCED
jgi:hypothetical protein